MFEQIYDPLLETDARDVQVTRVSAGHGTPVVNK